MVEPRSRAKRVAVTTCLLLAGAGLGWLAAKQSWFTRSAADDSSRLANTATVLVAVRDLARLESVSFHLERVIDLKERQARMYGLIQAEDAILLVAAGDVVAGIDLTKLLDGDVEIDMAARRARLRLPPPEILTVSLDNQRTYVHSRKTDLMAKRTVGIETHARQQAEQAIRSAALETRILERARQNAAHTLRALVRSLGYDDVQLEWRE